MLYSGYKRWSWLSSCDQQSGSASWQTLHGHAITRSIYFPLSFVVDFPSPTTNSQLGLAISLLFYSTLLLPMLVFSKNCFIFICAVAGRAKGVLL